MWLDEGVLCVGPERRRSMMSARPEMLDLAGFKIAQYELPGIDPSHGVVAGLFDPYEGPGIRFEPDRPLVFLPQQYFSENGKR